MGQTPSTLTSDNQLALNNTEANIPCRNDSSPSSDWHHLVNQHRACGSSQLTNALPSPCPAGKHRHTSLGDHLGVRKDTQVVASTSR